MSLEYKITKGNNQLLEIAEQHRDSIILLDFHADWCGPCKSISPLLHKLVSHYQNASKQLILCKIDVDENGNNDICDSYKIRAMPTFCWISNMKVIKRMQGADSDKVKEICESYCK